jgi:hypothetical protein
LNIRYCGTCGKARGAFLLKNLRKIESDDDAEKKRAKKAKKSKKELEGRPFHTTIQHAHLYKKIHIPDATGWKFCTGISLLTDYFALKNAY